MNELVNPWKLTPRLVDLIQLVAQGMTNEQAAQSLGVSPHTIKVQMGRLMRKMEVKNRTSAALLWDRVNRQESAS